jgi:hypothetical protein
VLKTLLFYPLELCRARITADTAAPGERRYASLRHAAASTWRADGLRGLYRGMGLSAVGVVPYLSISMAAYDEFKVRGGGGGVRMGEKGGGGHAPQGCCRRCAPPAAEVLGFRV